ncbi:MAG TPA: hypothetical protein VF559_03060 [Caulobacteraceae bacterium]
MNRIRRSAKTFGDILALRGVQQSAAEHQLALAGEAVRVAEEQRRDALDDLKAQDEAWLQAVRARRFDPLLARCWSDGIHRAQAHAADADSGVADAERRREQRGKEWCDALARAKVADALAKAAYKKLIRRRDEAAAMDMADRAAGGKLTR